MRAVWLREFGAPTELHAEETPEPSLAPGTALVDVAYANITFVETQARAGTGPFHPELPTVPGNGVGGVVRAVGDGVDPALVGTRVVGSTGGSGGYAEVALVPEAVLYPVPDGLALDAAVAVLADGRTASLLVEAAAIRPGERVLIEAAAGGVGTLLIQLAKAAGAVVVALAGGPRKTGLATDLGAAQAIDYRDPAWPGLLREPVDVVFDGVGGAIGRTAFEQLRRGGRILTYGLAGGQWTEIPEEEAERRGVRVVRPTAGPEDMRRLTESALRAAAEGRLRPVIGQRFPLERADEAHAAIQERRTVGKTLLVAGGAHQAGLSTP
ncbi:NADPH2:quinone reductase [Catenulispora sp. MAP12-49]|uniref:zinc-binding dehydrogenase n=1 Tax=Catenulispora sp. MAP12-49 TaxID=3156302 RepID=UPI0035171572